MVKLTSSELSQDIICLIKNLSPIIANKSLEITHLMYDKLFVKYPQFIDMFKDAPKNQPVLLAEALSAYAVNIDNLKILEPALRIIAVTHVAVGVKPQHYRMLGPVLIGATEEAIGKEATIEFIDAVREAYKYISDILIEMESEMYKEFMD